MKIKFVSLGVGETFVIKPQDQTCTWESFKVQVSVNNRKLKPKKFHSRRTEDGSFEVFRSA